MSRAQMKVDELGRVMRVVANKKKEGVKTVFDSGIEIMR